jgi:hypothetical protein
MVCDGVGIEMDVKRNSIVKLDSLMKFQNKTVEVRLSKYAYKWRVY